MGEDHISGEDNQARIIYQARTIALPLPETGSTVLIFTKKLINRKVRLFHLSHISAERSHSSHIKVECFCIIIL